MKSNLRTLVSLAVFLLIPGCEDPFYPEQTPSTIRTSPAPLTLYFGKLFSIETESIVSSDDTGKLADFMLTEGDTDGELVLGYPGRQCMYRMVLSPGTDISDVISVPAGDEVNYIELYEPGADVIYAVKTSRGLYAKIRVLQVYKKGAIGSWNIVFEYEIQLDGTTDFRGGAQ